MCTICNLLSQILHIDYNCFYFLNFLSYIPYSRGNKDRNDKTNTDTAAVIEIKFKINYLKRN